MRGHLRRIIISQIKCIISNLTWYFHIIIVKIGIDKILKLDYNNEIIYFNKFFKLHDGIRIFVCKADFLESDFIKISKIPNKVILITGNSDFSIENSYFTNLPGNVYKWYAQNATILNEKVIPIPLGIENYRFSKRRGHGITYKRAAEKIRLLSRDLNTTPTKFIYANFAISTNVEHRQRYYELIKNISHIDLDEPTLSISEFFNKILDYKMILCPIGNGIDTHRLWEVLYSKRVPIVIRIKDCKLFELYSQLPIIILETIDDLYDINLLEKSYSSVTLKKYNTDILNYSYWEKLILNDFN